jgi:hypothetical protein
MDPTLQSQIEIYLAHLTPLIQRGRQIREAIGANPADASVMVVNRHWQEDCGVTINQLSGGSKAHWLARAFSQAFLMRSANGAAVEGAAPAEIVDRLLGVLRQAVASLSQSDGDRIVTASSQAPLPHRFDFVHNAGIRPVLEQAYTDSRTALEQADYLASLLNSCSVLEAIVTDALEHKGLTALVESGAPAEKISDWSFETRLTVAERAGLIRGGCARLPPVARGYRDIGESGLGSQVSERDARLTGQVLHVVMRDLDPGR